MKTDKFPFVVGGAKFLADRTFSGDIAAFRCATAPMGTSLGTDARFEHISGGGETFWLSLGAGLKPGDVVVFCSNAAPAPQPKRRFDIEFREKGEEAWRGWSTGHDSYPPEFHPQIDDLDAYEYRVVEYEMVPVKATEVAFGPKGK